MARSRRVQRGIRETEQRALGDAGEIGTLRQRQVETLLTTGLAAVLPGMFF
jgi:hypothetical protein